jgi:hypothetical protein
MEKKKKKKKRKRRGVVAETTVLQFNHILDKINKIKNGTIESANIDTQRNFCTTAPGQLETAPRQGF